VTRRKLPELVAWAAGIALLLALWHRFQYGVELTDETFSIAMPYRYVLGDKPFVDEVTIQQTAGILLFPFVWLYVKLTGGTTGIVLFVRGVHLLIKAVAAVAVYTAARRWLRSRASAIAVAFVPFAYVPHSIANVGYNVLGTTLLVAGTFLSAAGIAGGGAGSGDEPDRRLLFVAGVCHGLCAFAYPPMIVAPLLATPLVFALAPSRRLAALGAFVAGGAVSFLLISPALAFGGVAGLRHSLAWGAPQTADEARLTTILAQWKSGLPSFYPYALGAVALAAALRSRALVMLVAPGIALATIFAFRDETPVFRAAIHTISYLAPFALLVLPLARPSRRVVRGALLVALPSYAAGIAAGVFSTQNADAISLGFHAAAVLFVVLAALALERAGAERVTCQIPAYALMLALLIACYDFVYRDQPLARLTTKTTVGPYKGLYTTADRAALSEELLELTRRFDQPGGRILFLYENPGMYLFSKMPPNAECVWEVHQFGQASLLDYWMRHVTGRGVVVRVKGLPRGAIVDPVVAPPGRKVYETRHFEVFREP
jgi:hypothetical protein